MNIQFRRKPDKEEAALAYNFIKEHKNLITSFLIAVAAIIIFVNIFRSNYEAKRILAADKLFEINLAFNNGDDRAVISNAPSYIKKFSSFDQAADILLILVMSYIRENNPDQAISTLERNLNISKNSVFKFSAYSILGGLYMDKWLIEEDPALAEKAGNYYIKASKSDSRFDDFRILYKAGNSFAEAGNIERAKEILKPLYDNSQTIDPGLRDQIKFLYENIDLLKELKYN